jgi:MFS family permease
LLWARLHGPRAPIVRTSGFAPGGTAWLAAICLSRVGACMVYISSAAALPVLQRQWQMSATAAGTIASSFQAHLTGTLASLVAGLLADRWGRTPVIFTMATLSRATAISRNADGIARLWGERTYARIADSFRAGRAL